MTLRDIVRILENAGVQNAKNDAVILLEELSGLSRAKLFADADYDIERIPGSDGWLALLDANIKRRASREPLQYIIGHWSFYGDDFIVSPDCLIPRPETEMLVDHALKHIKSSAHIADLCCGSGAIGIAICKRSGCSCVSVDISQPALDIAKKNAERLGVSDKITFLSADVLSPDIISGKFDMILCNPPYIKTNELDALEPELSAEPKIALDGGFDGMKFYRAVLKNYRHSLKENGAMIFEIGADESGDIIREARSCGFECSVMPDLAGKQRMAIISPLSISSCR